MVKYFQKQRRIVFIIQPGSPFRSMNNKYGFLYVIEVGGIFRSAGKKKIYEKAVN